MNCSDTQELLMDYLEGNLDKTARKEFELHLNECKSCEKELKDFQQTIIALESESDVIQIPDDFMSNVRQAVADTQKSRRKIYQRPAVMGLVAALFLTLFVGTAVAMNGFENFMEWWKDFGNKQDERMQDYVQHGLGDYLNLVAESNGVKVTITSVVADDIQTLIYYEVEDQKKENKYMINYTEGLRIANQDDLWSNEDDYSPVNNHLSIYSESSHVYKGRLGTAPLSTNEGTIQLELSKLQKVIEAPADAEGPESPLTDTIEFIEGDWQFDIPFKKHSAIVHELQVETEIDGNPVIFEKLTIAPTITVLSYRYRNENPDRRMDYMTIDSLESNGKRVYTDPFRLGGYGGGGGYASGWNSAEATFESLYFEKPMDIRVHIGSASFSITEKADFAIDVSKAFPQVLEYLGTKITIEDIEIGVQTKIEMSEELNPNRVYERLDYRFYDEEDRGSSVASVDGYYIDKDGMKYKAMDYFYRLNELENPRFFSTEHHIELSREDQKGDYIPIGIEIEGYRITSIYDNIVEITLDE
ncbi:DUF4179 domain-containing protein [Sporosarcina soli]|uniref:Anti-sigma-W factor RsiW n=1 Tax=Sporosarcina soli TaxID=334736 RepID=A0ABW0TFL0_9BACL